MKPSNFCTWPWSSALGKSECEQIALNVMVILKRTGDEWRELSWDEYLAARIADGEIEWRALNERQYFDAALPYCKSADTAVLFSDTWKELIEA